MAIELMNTAEAYGHDMDLFNEIHEIGWSETPFLSSLTMKAPRARSGAYNGHNWKYRNRPKGKADNKHIEGAPSSAATKYGLGSGLNHYQILRDPFGVTRSEMRTSNTDGKTELAAQGDMARIDHMLSFEMALVSNNAPVQRVGDTVAGQMGGLKHYLTANTDLGATGATLDWGLLRELLKIQFLNGAATRYVMMGDKQKDALDDILFQKTSALAFNVTKIDNNVTNIGNTAYGNNIKVILNPFLADDEIISYNTDFIFPVIWDPTHIAPVNGDYDGTKKEFITEATLHVGHEYALARLKGLAV